MSFSSRSVTHAEIDIHVLRECHTICSFDKFVLKERKRKKPFAIQLCNNIPSLNPAYGNLRLINLPTTSRLPGNGFHSVSYPDRLEGLPSFSVTARAFEWSELVHYLDGWASDLSDVLGAKMPNPSHPWDFLLFASLYSKGRILGHKRGKRNTRPNTSLIQIEGVASKEDTQFYLGKVWK